ncbi:N-acetylaspartate synthetase [Plakobranchus ocellatus]|uniref:N-acetylaspartate synthetase n=1 Tax=Plakobranchus ocellatus TaxID=259542 RepID=A0AAV4AUD6_9GAST|nr:N-acetylaspartate synthetase [Plakobranchus ocellatus]
MFDAAEITIRTWQPCDDDAVWSILQEGSHSNINSTFLLCLKKPVLRALSVIVIVIGLANGLSTVALIPCFICGIGVIYAVSVLSSYIYLYSSTLTDIKDIQDSYFSDPDNHFWVAECDHEIVGTIAIMKKSPILDVKDSDSLGCMLAPLSGQDARGEARTRGRKVPADLRTDLSAEDNRQRFSNTCTNSLNIARPLTLPQIMRRANVPPLPRGSQMEHRHCAEISSSKT